jgi:recombinational DNA repair protein RecR
MHRTGELNFPKLVKRIDEGIIREVIIATNPTRKVTPRPAQYRSGRC